MPTHDHYLELYEPYDYEGPNPLQLRGVGLVTGPGGTGYYLLNLLEPVRFEHETIRQLLIECRYSDDALERAINSKCTVRFSRVLPGVDLTLDSAFRYEDFVSWGVGKITPARQDTRS